MSRYWKRTKQVLGVAAAVGLAACASSAPPETAAAPVPDTVVIVDTVTLEVEAAANAELEQRLARLQIELLDKDAQVDGLRAQLDAAHQEVVRNMAKLQSQATRAEAASGMAEAEIALRDLRATTGGQVTPAIQEAQQLLNQSGEEFGKDNYAGSLYLASQARTIAERSAFVPAGEGSSLQPGEQLFGVPVPLQTLTRSNIRGGPGLNFPILFTLDPGGLLVGRSHTDEWVRVTDEQGRMGWIFHTLVGTRN